MVNRAPAPAGRHNRGAVEKHAAPLELMTCLTGISINMAPRWGWSVSRLFRLQPELIDGSWGIGRLVWSKAAKWATGLRTQFAMNCMNRRRSVRFWSAPVLWRFCLAEAPRQRQRTGALHDAGAQVKTLFLLSTGHRLT